MTPTTAAIRTAHGMWRMAHLYNRREDWDTAHDGFFALMLFSGVLGNWTDEDYFNELAIAASEIAAECR